MKFNYGDVEQHCNELYNVSNSIKEIFDNISGEIKKIHGSEAWIGPASDDFVERINSAVENFDILSNNLQGAIYYIATCSSNYRSVENNIVNEIKNNLNIKG